MAIRGETKTDRIFYTVNTILLVIFMLVLLIPVIFIVSASFSSAEAVVTGKVFLWPVEPTLAGYEGVFRNDRVIMGFGNSALYLVIDVIIGVTLTLTAAFPLSIGHLPGRKFFTLFFTFTMLFSGGMIPTFMLVRDLGLLDTIWGVTVPGSLSVFHIILVRSYIKNNLPEELYEAASMDGCTPIRYLWQFVIPLSGAIIAVIALYVAVASWNGWFNAMLYLSDNTMYPLQMVLREILIMSQVDYTMMSPDEILKAQEMADLLKYSLIVVSSTPMMALYPFIQRYFVRGVMAGAVKG